MEFVVSSSQILGFCAFITALWGVWKIVKELKKPSDDIRSLVDKHGRAIEADDKRLEEIEASNQLILKCLSVIINHEITGNNIDKMKETRDKLQEYLIDR